MTRIYNLEGRTTETVAEALKIAAEIAADPQGKAWARYDVQTGQAVALVVEIAEEGGA